MSRYFFVENGQIVDGPRALPESWRNVSGLNKATVPELVALGWLPEVQIGNDPINPDTQVKEGPIYTVNATEVLSTWTIRAMTAQELAARNNEISTQFLLSGLLLNAQLLITLVDVLLAKGVIAVADFDVDTRNKYQQLKTHVDRLR